MNQSMYIYEINDSLDPLFCEHVIARFESGAPSDAFEADVLLQALEEGCRRYAADVLDALPASSSDVFQADNVRDSNTGFRVTKSICELEDRAEKWQNPSQHSGSHSRYVAYKWFLNEPRHCITRFPCADVLPRTGKLVLFPATWTYSYKECVTDSSELLRNIFRTPKYTIDGFVLEMYAMTACF